MDEEDSLEGGPEEEAVAYCSICGSKLPDGDFALNYPNFVCDECNSTAVNEDGETPWHGWPPGEEPESEPGVIQMVPDHGENPVYINGIKCWRRYRFGGHIAFRDTFDCDTLGEFYDAHEKEDGFFQIYNSPKPPEACTDQDRILVQKADQDDWEIYAWGMLSVETGEIISRNAAAEQVLGPFEKFLDRVKEHAGGEEYYKQAITDPTWLLSVFYSFGTQAHKPKVLYLVSELDQPLSGLNGIVKTGALRGLRQHDVAQDLFELGFQTDSHCNALAEESEDNGPSQMTLTEMEQSGSSGNINDTTLTIRYELPHKGSPKGLLNAGIEIAQSILQEIDLAVEQTDYTYLTSLPAVDIHAYSNQEEVLTIGIGASTVQETDWERLSEEPKKLRELALTFQDSLKVKDSDVGTDPFQELELPEPRESSIEAITAAKEYVLSQGGATKEEIVETLVPEENYPIRHNGAPAKAKGVTPTFRDWWWREIVEPGLQGLSGVNWSEDEEVWYPVGDNR